jgi:hypothetical protein
MELGQMRYCKDCEHFASGTAEYRAPFCQRFKREFVVSESPVFGPRKEFSAPECVVARAEKGQCGPQARFYVARSGTEAWMMERELARQAIAKEAQEELAPLRRDSWWQRFYAWLT